LPADVAATASPALEDYWRGLILFGRNVASYKFSLGKALLDLRAAPGDLVKLTQTAALFWIKSQLIRELIPIPAKLAEAFEVPVEKSGDKSWSVH